MLLGIDFCGPHAELQAVAEAVAEEDEALGIAKRQGAQEHAIDEREDGCCSSDTQREGKHYGKGKAGRFPELAECCEKVAHRQRIPTQSLDRDTHANFDKLAGILDLVFNDYSHQRIVIL